MCVADNQLVKKGDVLVEIDPVDYNVRVDEAGASLSSERSRLAEMGARISVAKAQQEEMTSQAEGARINLEVQKKNLIQAELDIKKAAAATGSPGSQAAPGGTGHQAGRRSLRARRRSPAKNTRMSRRRADVAAAQVKVAREQLDEAVAARDAQAGRVKQAEVDIKRIEAAWRTQQERDPPGGDRRPLAGRPGETAGSDRCGPRS